MVEDYVYNKENNAIYKYSSLFSDFDAREKDSAVQKLFEAFQPVLGADNGRYNGLALAVGEMRAVSNILNQNNYGLGSSWNEAADSCKKMEDKISTIIIDIVKEVNNYIEATYAEELAVTKITEEFNENIKNINNSLDELDNL